MPEFSTAHLAFNKLVGKPRAQTHVYAVDTRETGITLGYVKWYSPWRRYCFNPIEQTVYDSECLNDIRIFINGLMDERRKALGVNRADD